VYGALNAQLMAPVVQLTH